MIGLVQQRSGEQCGEGLAAGFSVKANALPDGAGPLCNQNGGGLGWFRSWKMNETGR